MNLGIKGIATQPNPKDDGVLMFSDGEKRRRRKKNK